MMNHHFILIRNASRRTGTHLLLALASLASLVSSSACSGAEAGWAIRNVTVITGDGRPPLPDRTVIVRDGTIVAVQPADDAAAQPVARIIDGNGRYLLPGFVDTHVHVAMGPVSVDMDQGQPVMVMEPLDSVGRRRHAPSSPTASHSPGTRAGRLSELWQSATAWRTASFPARRSRWPEK